jgi:hypothetical protein
MRATALTMVVGAAAMVGGCAPETDGVFTDVDSALPAPERCAADADCGPGVRCGGGVCAKLVAVECIETTDCPRLECHQAPVCMGGVCLTARLPARQPCQTGICSDAGECESCASDSECESVNVNECHDLFCSNEGTCEPRQKPDGAACNFTAGHCLTSAACLAD